MVLCTVCSYAQLTSVTSQGLFKAHGVSRHEHKTCHEPMDKYVITLNSPSGSLDMIST